MADKASANCGPQLAFYVGRKAYNKRAPATKALARYLANRVAWKLCKVRAAITGGPIDWSERYNMEARLYKRAVPRASMYVARWLRAK